MNLSKSAKYSAPGQGSEDSLRRPPQFALGLWGRERGVVSASRAQACAQRGRRAYGKKQQPVVLGGLPLSHLPSTSGVQRESKNEARSRT